MFASKNLLRILRCIFNNNITKDSTAKMFSLNQQSQKAASNSRNLLAANTPLQLPKRTNMAEKNAVAISMENPLADYKTQIENMLERNDDDDEQMARYKKIAEEARKVVWELLFSETNSPAKHQKKAGELLNEHKKDACFYVPWEYNDWILGVRDELLKRKMFDFWHNFVVKESLGPCWAKDSDYFDDLEDPEPAKFYHFAGAVASWEKSKQNTPTTAEVESALPTPNPTAGTSQSSAVVPLPADLKISLQNPLEDYKRLIEVNLTQNTAFNDEQIEAIYKMIAENARNTVWALVFDDPQPSEDCQKKAGDLLSEHKPDACFYAPWVYNEWIVKFRDELLKRNLINFWRDHVVKRELGLCWAKDTDFYDDLDDPEPAKFYKHANCFAPWLKEEAQNKDNESKTSKSK